MAEMLVPPPLDRAIFFRHATHSHVRSTMSALVYLFTQLELGVTKHRAPALIQFHSPEAVLTTYGFREWRRATFRYDTRGDG